MDAQLALRLHQLRHELLGARNRGRVTVELADGAQAVDLASARHLADAMMALVNFPPLGPHWRPCDRERAGAIVAAVLHEDLERERQLLPSAAARALAGKFLAEFPPEQPTTFLTNVRPAADLNQSPHRWASGSQAAELDAGVAAVSASLVGLLWVEDRP